MTPKSALETAHVKTTITHENKSSTEYSSGGSKKTHLTQIITIYNYYQGEKYIITSESISFLGVSSELNEDKYTTNMTVEVIDSGVEIINSDGIKSETEQTARKDFVYNYLAVEEPNPSEGETPISARREVNHSALQIQSLKLRHKCLSSS